MLQNLCLPFGPFSINPLQHMRSHQDCPIPFPCAFSFLILQYALRFGGGGRPKKQMVLPQLKATNFFCLVDPRPPQGNSVRSMSATLATLRCLCDVCYCDVARDVTVSSYILS